jgi:hypothetical protein
VSNFCLIGVSEMIGMECMGCLICSWILLPLIKYYFNLLIGIRLAVETNG